MATPGISLPNAEEVGIARDSASALSELLTKMPMSDRAQVKLDGTDIILPRHAIELLRDILSDMAQGNAVTIVPLHAEMTTQQAADFLNVSRPFFVKLLEGNAIPYVKVGTHRRVKFQDLVRYKEEMRQNSDQAMDELVGLAQQHDMGY
jgi:excisionase family DNA binding protein